MLKSIIIKHYALIDELIADFSDGLVILTGETGAGKSIIIDALSLILGGRASAEVVRTGAEKAIVEGLFTIAGNRKVKSLLEENGLEYSDELIIRREVSAKGQSRCFINDSPTTLALQKHVGELLVDLHGQHEHQSLLHVENHIDMLDNFGGLNEMVNDFQSAYKKLEDLTGELRETRQRERLLLENREFHAFQMREIDAIAPQLGEEEHLESELRILENAEELFGTTGELYQLLYGGDRSVHDLLVKVQNKLNDLTGIDHQFEEAVKESGSALAVVSELAKSVQHYHSQIEFSAERLEHLRERLGRLALLKKKYGGSLDDVIAYREKIGQELQLGENFTEVIEKLLRECEAARNDCALVAQCLSSKRQGVARKMDKAIVGELRKLGIQNGKFATRIRQVELLSDQVSNRDAAAHYIKAGEMKLRLNPRGCNAVEFFISTNTGEEVKPLARVASGGEVSRIMLALKSILAKSDRLPVLIFDEIDVGVSGRVAQAVGLSLKDLSRFHQVIAITHLPQIAGLADSHFMVYKSDDGSRAITSIKKLSSDERVREVASLMSGEEVTEAGLKGARELMSVSRDN
ncbi:MAG: DNA repair protein RecN [Ignavibacteria bacterium]|nr:DNA repair protein RecN [Ignavibacteria bacterium]